MPQPDQLPEAVPRLEHLIDPRSAWSMKQNTRRCVTTGEKRYLRSIPAEIPRRFESGVQQRRRSGSDVAGAHPGDRSGPRGGGSAGGFEGHGGVGHAGEALERGAALEGGHGAREGPRFQRHPYRRAEPDPRAAPRGRGAGERLRGLRSQDRPRLVRRTGQASRRAAGRERRQDLRARWREGLGLRRRHQHPQDRRAAT